MHNLAISIRYGIPGHEREYVVMIGSFGFNRYIPDCISEAIQTALPETLVLNRGSRIEVMTDDKALTEIIYDCVSKTLNDRPWIWSE